MNLVLKVLILTIFLALMEVNVGGVRWYQPLGELQGTPTVLSGKLFSAYLLQLELVGVILLAAMVGAIFLARREAA
ncbi:MAG: hypothetical protein AABX40_07595 [Candidatus Hydrothermarchaeota archaeon]